MPAQTLRAAGQRRRGRPAGRTSAGHAWPGRPPPPRAELPLLWDRGPHRQHGTLRVRGPPTSVHEAAGQPVLAVFRGPQAYVTPSWYPSKAATAKVVPTWNYAVVHLRGGCAAVEDAPGCARWSVATDTHEAARSRTAGRSATRPGLHRADAARHRRHRIVVESVQAKWKMTQNRDAADRAGVAAGLASLGTDETRAAARVGAPGALLDRDLGVLHQLGELLGLCLDLLRHLIPGLLPMGSAPISSMRFLKSGDWIAFDHLGAQAREHVLGRGRRREHAEPGADVEPSGRPPARSAPSGSADEALGGGHRQRPQLAGLVCGSTGVIVSKDIVTRPPIRSVTGGLCPYRDVRGSVRSGSRTAYRSGVARCRCRWSRSCRCPGSWRFQHGHQFGDVLRRRVGVDHQHVRHHGDDGDRREVLLKS